MDFSEELERFIGSSFRSVWALELLIMLRSQGCSCSIDELNMLMRASPAVIVKAVDALAAAGLVSSDEGFASYMPINSSVDLLVQKTEQLYRARPDRVRRLIVNSSHTGLAAFSEAFRLKD